MASLILLLFSFCKTTTSLPSDTTEKEIIDKLGFKIASPSPLTIIVLTGNKELDQFLTARLIQTEAKIPTAVSTTNNQFNKFFDNNSLFIFLNFLNFKLFKLSCDFDYFFNLIFF